MTKMSYLHTKKENAYLTVEATLVMAIVLPFLFFVMSWMIYVYNRCLFEQDLEIIALRGVVWNGNKDGLLTDLRNQQKSLYQEKYIYLNKKELGVKMEGNRLQLSQSASMPMWGGNAFKIGNKWEINANCVNHRINEVIFLRSCRKVKQGREKK